MQREERHEIHVLHDNHRTVTNTVDRSGYSTAHILGIPVISRSWYYSQMDFSPLLDGRCNPLAAGGEEWIVLGFKHRNPMMSFMEIAYTLMVEDLAYLSPSTVNRILKKHDLITPWNRKTWKSTRPEHARRSDEK